jgi:hypothetical protein
VSAENTSVAGVLRAVLVVLLEVVTVQENLGQTDGRRGDPDLTVLSWGYRLVIRAENNDVDTEACRGEGG